MEFIRNRRLIIKHAVPIHIQQNLGGAALGLVVLYHYCVQLLLEVVLTENIMTKALFGGPADVGVELDKVLENRLKPRGHPVQSIHEVVGRRGALDVLDLFQVLMHVLRINVGCVKLIQWINLFNYYSNLVLLAYIHRLALVVLLVIVGSFYREREAGVAWEEDSLSLLIGRWIGRLHDLEDYTAHAPHVLRLVVLLLQQ